MSDLQVSAASDGVVVIAWDRPPGNLLSIDMCRELADVLRRPPSGAHIVWLRPAGDVFCLGRERPAGTAGALRDESEVLVEVHRALRETSLVTVAEAPGDAAGFGAGLLAGCDVAVAAPEAHVFFPEVGIDLAPSLVLAWLPRTVGRRAAFWLTATGEPIDASRAVALGLLNAVASSRQELTRAVDTYVDALRTAKPRVLSEIRELLRAGEELHTDQALELSIDRLVVGSLRRNDF